MPLSPSMGFRVKHCGIWSYGNVVCLLRKYTSKIFDPAGFEPASSCKPGKTHYHYATERILAGSKFWMTFTGMRRWRHLYGTEFTPDIATHCVNNLHNDEIDVALQFNIIYLILGFKVNPLFRYINANILPKFRSSGIRTRVFLQTRQDALPLCYGAYTFAG